MGLVTGRGLPTYPLARWRVAPAAGRGRIKLAKLLAAAGVRVEPEDIEVRGGRLRNRTGGDGARWEAHEAFAQGHPAIPDGVRMPLLSYATVGELTRFDAVELEWDQPLWLVHTKGHDAAVRAAQARTNAEAEERERNSPPTWEEEDAWARNFRLGDTGYDR